MDADWWRQAVVYQIYPRSFADANGDGIGDLAGIISRIGYLEQLGVDAVWLSPFYPSALADGGYDVDDYRDVDPRIGTLEQFDALVAALHEAGIWLIVDIVPNHSSNRHRWFQEALASAPGSPARDRYIFRDGLGAGGSRPPSDWTSQFGGPAWTRVPDGQWYFHTFTVEQPELNWDNPEVRAEFLDTLRFWADRGVDGFRVDVAARLAKKFPEPMPSQAELSRIPSGPDSPVYDRDEVQSIYAEWRRVFNEYDPPRMAVAEVWVNSPERRARYARPESLGQAFNFDLLKADFDAEQFRRIVTSNLDQVKLSGSSSTWVLSNHDVVRHATRYGLRPDGGRPGGRGDRWVNDGAPASQIDRGLGLRRARAATLVELALPGSAYLYQGEELGLGEVTGIPDEQRQDPKFWRTRDDERPSVGRDGCRVPLPWTRSGPSFGFGPDDSAAGPHLPQPDWFADCSVEAESGDPSSTLGMYRRALELRREMQGGETLEWDDGLSVGDVLAFSRPGGWLCVANFGDDPVPLPSGRVLVSSAPLIRPGTDGPARIPGACTVWLSIDAGR
ncbi:glycoside hydrolase family 13 protein [Acidipropionibacterium acidipropionici]|uniref:glycoside hydrolase family 13 protein n=1 Tax=Acidipropionibacterium acidipropionici TaxID=1748 RepID=UPI000407EC4B|nr:glycoside hydrolase family 13 protein [Acidipropionibacterium acidipropionici]ALN14943.1 alpha-amylase [Acidipropionibacterium acidipropionici]APZ09305.1 alpha-amylase [Acidipropionibacterium acidipropionici]MDN6557584.1 glycoside hydrolase family 13 protein [Acidipropionibacterium acidipropionici]